MRLKEEDGVLARIWREGCKLASSLRKSMGVGGIHGQAKLAFVVEDDSIALLEAEWVNNSSTLNAANTALSGSLNTTSGPQGTTPWTLLIHERIVAKGDFVRYHRTRRGCQ
jgi:hypothetical protein